MAVIVLIVFVNPITVRQSYHCRHPRQPIIAVIVLVVQCSDDDDDDDENP